MPTNFCPDCGTRVVPGQKFCGECGSRFSGEERPEPSPGAIVRSDLSTDAVLKDSVVSRSTVQAGGAIEGSAVSRSEVRTQSAQIRDAVISHSTITQTETHQHFGESVGTYEAQMDLGRTAFEGKNWTEAVDFFNTALKIDSRHYEPWFLKGMSCAELRRVDEAVTNLRRALKLAGPKAGSVLDDVRGLADRISRAAAQQERAANELLGRSRAELQYSVAYQQPARKGGDGIVSKTLSLDLSFIPVIGQNIRPQPQAPTATRASDADRREEKSARLEEQAKGHLSEAVRLWNSSIRLCDLVLEFQRQDEFGYLKRGEIFFRLKLYDDACKSYETLLGFSPDHREALRLRGMCFTTQGRPIPPPPGAPAAARPAQAPPETAAPGPAPHATAATAQVPPATAAPAQAPHATAATAPPPQPTGHAGPILSPGAPPVQAPPPKPAPQTVMIPPVGPGRATQAAPPPPQYGLPGTAQAGPSRANPCPFCRGEMNFLRERAVWQCSSCRQFSARPAR